MEQDRSHCSSGRSGRSKARSTTSRDKGAHAGGHRSWSSMLRIVWPLADESSAHRLYVADRRTALARTQGVYDVTHQQIEIEARTDCTADHGSKHPAGCPGGAGP